MELILTQQNNLVDFVIEQIEDLKGRDISTLDVREQSTVTDYFIVCSGNSKRHVQSIAQNIQTAAKHADIELLGVEGHVEGEWVLVDLGNVVVHVMQDQTRDFYQLEKLWAQAPSESAAG